MDQKKSSWPDFDRHVVNLGKLNKGQFRFLTVVASFDLNREKIGYSLTNKYTFE